MGAQGRNLPGRNCRERGDGADAADARGVLLRAAGGPQLIQGRGELVVGEDEDVDDSVAENL